jgi:uncharacterized protein YutE (UPF0331/DUF86 family)
MTPSGIDLKVVGDRLALVEGYLAELRALPASSFEEFLADRRTAPAAESHLRHAIEALFDTARHMLAKGFGIGKLEYREIARLAGEKGLVTDPELVARFGEIGGFRNRLIHHYGDVTREEIFGIVRSDLGDLDALAAALKNAAGRLARRG